MPDRPPDPGAGAQPYWPMVEAGFAAGLSFLSAFVIARIVGPAELGIGAAAVAVAVLLWVAVNALFADPLTQSDSTDPREISTAFWASCVCGVLAALAQAGCGPLLAFMLDDARLVPMCLALALPLPLVGAAGAMQGLLTRARRYRALAGRAMIGQGMGTLLGVLLALAGAGGWAVVAQQVATTTIGALWLLTCAEWRPVLAWRAATVRQMLRIGLPITGGTLVQLGRYRLFLLLAGGMLGPAALGQLHIAFRLVDTLRELVATALWRLLLPSLAEHRDDPAALIAAMERAQRDCGLALFPVCGLVLVALDPLVHVFLGLQWGDSADAALPLIGLMAWTILAFPANVAAIVRGGAHIALLLHCASLALTFVGILALPPQTPLDAVWLWVGAQAIALPWLVWRIALLLEIPPWRLFGAGLAPLALSAVAAVLAMLAVGAGPGLGTALRRVAVFLLIYLPVAALLRGFWPIPRWRAGRAMFRRARFLPLPLLTLLLVPLAARPAWAQGLLEQLPPSIPGYDSRLGVPLLARVETRMRELGVDIGATNLRPAIDVGVGYDSNPRGAARAQDSFYSALGAGLGGIHRADGATIAGFAAVDDRRYFSAPTQNYTNWSAAVGAGAELGGGQLNLAAAHLSLHQERSDLDAIASDRPIGFTVDDARASYTHRFNRLSLTPNAEFTVYRFASTTIAGIPTTQLYRDRQVARAALAGRYELAPDSSIIFVLGAAATRYPYGQGGLPSRDSTDGLALIGVDSGPAGGPTGDTAALWRYSVLAGVQSRSFAASGLPMQTQPALDAQLHFQPTGLTGIGLRLTRAIEDTARLDRASVINNRARLVLEHEYARDLIVQLSGGMQLAEYRGADGLSFNAGARALWLINANLRASLSYDFTRWREGLQDAAPQDGMRLRNLVLASLRLTP